MTIRVTFELSDADVRHFKRISKTAKEFAKGADEATLINAAVAQLRQANDGKMPDFIAERLRRLQSLIDMLQDAEWNLAGPERERVLSAIAYFSESQDLIPDATPGLGFLDDAIMIELVTRELKHEIEAYDDFCAFRNRETKVGREGSHEKWLAEKRRELHERMRRRIRRDRSSGTRVRIF